MDQGSPPQTLEAGGAAAPPSRSSAIARSILGDPRYRGLYLSSLRITWPGKFADSIYKGTEGDLDTIYPEDLAAAVSEISEKEAFAASFGDPSRLSAEKLVSRAANAKEIENLTRLIRLHERRARGGHLALAERLGGDWDDFLRSLGSLLFLIETAEEKLSGASRPFVGARKPSSGAKEALEDTLAEVSSILSNLDDLKIQLNIFLSSGSSGSMPFSPAASSPAASSAADSTPAAASAATSPAETAPSEANPPGPQKSRKASSLLSSAKACQEALAAWRSLALEALLSCEKKLFSWRGKGIGSAPEAAPEPLGVPAPPTSFSAKGSFEESISEASPRLGRGRLWVMAVFTLLLAAATLVVAVTDPAKPPEPFRLYVYNGLGAAVTVRIGKSSQDIPMGGLATGSLAPGKSMRISASTKENLIEVFEGTPESLSGLSGAETSDDSILPAIVYNVGGGAPLIEWVAVYASQESDGPLKQTRLGAPVFLATRADFVLSPPPNSIKVKGSDRSRVVLSAISGVHPDRMLEAAPESEREALIETQARWGSTSALWTPLWLERLARLSPQALEVLSERLEDHPLDPRTNELFLATAENSQAVAWCQSLQGLLSEAGSDNSEGSRSQEPQTLGAQNLESPNLESPSPESRILESRNLESQDLDFLNQEFQDSQREPSHYQEPLGQENQSQDSQSRDSLAQDFSGDKAFLSALCLPAGERPKAIERLLAEFPDHPWLNRAEGFELFRRDDVGGALARLETALASEPSSLSADLTTLARLRRSQGMSLEGIAWDLGPLDQSLGRLSRRAPIASGSSPPTPRDDQDAEDLAYALLEAGRFDEAMSLAGDASLADKILILAAASPGAPNGLLQRAASLSKERVLAAEAPWTYLGLFIRASSPENGLERAPDPSALEAAIREAGSDPNGPAPKVIEAIKSGRADLLPSLYLGRDPWFQGQACLAAWLALGDAAPEDCLSRASGFLFPGERPPLDSIAKPAPTAAVSPAPYSSGLDSSWPYASELDSSWPDSSTSDTSAPDSRDLKPLGSELIWSDLEGEDSLRPESIGNEPELIP